MIKWQPHNRGDLDYMVADIREGGAILEVAMDNDDNDFSKECCIGADIIKSYVTKGIPPLPPVQSRVTACHAMRGTHSARNDIREEGAILEVAMDDDDMIFLRNAILGPTSSKATLLKEYRLSLQLSQKASSTYTSQQRQHLVNKCLWNIRQL
jgi:hypothetical protein